MYTVKCKGSIIGIVLRCAGGGNKTVQKFIFFCFLLTNKVLCIHESSVVNGIVSVCVVRNVFYYHHTDLNTCAYSIIYYILYNIICCITLLHTNMYIIEQSVNEKKNPYT